MVRLQLARPAVRHLFLGASVLSLTGPVAARPAHGETVTTPAPTASVEEVLVTARRRTEALEHTPISITAVTGAGLETRGVTELNAIADFTPNLVFQNNPSFGGASGAASIYIRGVGQKDFVPTVEPGVGLYVDGVYVARSVGAILDLVDVDHVEVLRGPQGTLFGRNTIGGAISIVSRQPSSIYEGDVSATLGRGNRRDLKASLNLPVNDRLAISGSVASIQRDGYVHRISDGLDLGDENRLVGRLTARLQVTDTLKLTAALDGTRAREHGAAIELLGVNFGSAVFNPKGLPLAPPGAPAPAGSYGLNPPFDAPTDNFALLNNYLAFLGGQPCLSGFGQPYSPQGSGTSPACYDSRYVRPRGEDAGTGAQFSDLDIWGASLTAEWALGAVTLKSITAYRNLDSSFARDGDHSPLEIVHFDDDLKQEQISQEVQALGESWDGALKWIGGLYALREAGDNINRLQFTPVDFRSGGKFGTTSLAAFGQGTFAITSRLNLTAGLRYTQDRKSFLPDQVITANRTPDPNLAPGTRILPLTKVTNTFSEWTPMVNVAYDVTDDIMGYATLSRGFKSGGFVQRVFPPLSKTPTFAPETADVFEIGAKSTFLDRRLQVNASAFYTAYQHLQVQVFQAVAPVTENAARARVLGFEGELQARPGDGWSLEAAAGYLDPKYTAIDADATEITRDKTFERVSKWSLSAAASRRIELGAFGALTPRIDWAYRSKFYNDAANTAQIAQAAYQVANASLAWDAPSGRYSGVLGVTNLGDKRYLQSGVFDANFGQYEGLFARGREWFVTAKSRF